MKTDKILFITQEINPYVPESALTYQGREIPLYALEQNREVRAFMPKFGNINERRNQLHEVIRLSGMNIVVDDIDHPLIIKVASVSGTRMQVYFIDNEEFFGKRLEVGDETGVEYTDNAERATFYARGVLETVKKLRWTPDVIVCQGWMSTIAPLYIKTAYADEPSFRNCKVIYSITDESLTLPTSDRIANILEYKNVKGKNIEEFGKTLTPAQLNMLAVKYSDGIIISTDTPNQDVIEYVKKSGKPAKEITDKDNAKYLQFIDEVWSIGKEIKEN